MSPNCCCDGPCSPEYPLCSGCSIKWIPRWKIQANIPGETKKQWILTRTSSTSWGYNEGGYGWTLDYNPVTGGYSLQAWFGGYIYTASGTMGSIMTGTLSGGQSYRICSLGINAPKEFVVTISGAKTCWNTGNDYSLGWPNLFWYGIRITGVTPTGNINGTYRVPMTNFSPSWAGGCGDYKLSIGTMHTKHEVTGEQVDWDITIELSSSGKLTPYIYAHGYVPKSWLMYPDWHPQNVLLGFFYLPSNVPVAFCDDTWTETDYTTQCGYAWPIWGGTMTITPVHDDNFTPPTTP